MNRLIPFLVMLLTLSVTTGLGAERKFEKKFAVKPGGLLRVETDYGWITVVGTAASEVSVVADIKGSLSDLEDFNISAAEIENGIEVIGRGKSMRWWSWAFDDLDVRYTIEVPRDYNLDLTSSGGDINLKDIQGKVEAGTSGGDVRVGDVDGSLVLSTSGGDIVVERATGNLKAETSGGDISIFSVTGTVDAGTSGGDVRINNVDGKVRAETSGGDIIVAVRGDNKGIFAETSGGDIDIVVGKDTRATIDASTSGGAVSCNLPLTISGEIDESEVRGSVNGGGDPIYAHTSGGDIRIRTPEKE